MKTKLGILLCFLMAAVTADGQISVGSAPLFSGSLKLADHFAFTSQNGSGRVLRVLNENHPNLALNISSNQIWCEDPTTSLSSTLYLSDSGGDVVICGAGGKTALGGNLSVGGMGTFQGGAFFTGLPLADFGRGLEAGHYSTGGYSYLQSVDRDNSGNYLPLDLDGSEVHINSHSGGATEVSGVRMGSNGGGYTVLGLNGVIDDGLHLGIVGSSDGADHNLYIDCLDTDGNIVFRNGGGNGITLATLSSSGLLLMSTPVSGVADPVSPQDAATKAYVDKIFTMSATLVSGTASVADPRIAGATLIAIANTGVSIANMGALQASVSGTTASVRSSNASDTSTFNITFRRP